MAYPNGTTIRSPLSEGKKRTASRHRFLVVAEYVAGDPAVVYRTDVYERARARRRKVGRDAFIWDQLTETVLDPALSTPTPLGGGRVTR